MPIAINHIQEMYNLRNQTLNKFGKDQTGQITYQFNSQGWRNSYEHNFVPQYAFFGNSSVLGIGVHRDQIFTSMFEDSYNCGLAVNYTNQDIATSILNFINSDLFDPQVKIAVVWTDRNPEQIVHCYNQVKDLNLKNFFCGTSIKKENCWAMIPQIDKDVSGTHMGPATHRLFFKFLCNVFNH